MKQRRNMVKEKFIMFYSGVDTKSTRAKAGVSIVVHKSGNEK